MTEAGRTRGASYALPERQAGFTLIEIMVVLAVMGLMVALVAMNGPLGSATMDLTAATQLVMGDLRAARAQAIALDRPVRVSLVADGALAVDGVAKHPPPPGIRVALRPAVVVFGPEGGSDGGRVDLFSGGLSSGGLSSGGLSSGVRRASVMVDWPGGRVRLAEAP